MHLLVNYIDPNYSVNFAVNCLGIVDGKVDDGVSFDGETAISFGVNPTFSSFLMIPVSPVSRVKTIVGKVRVFLYYLPLLPYKAAGVGRMAAWTHGGARRQGSGTCWGLQRRG